jgi:hypothetical protein
MLNSVMAFEEAIVEGGKRVEKKHHDHIKRSLTV